MAKFIARFIPGGELFLLAGLPVRVFERGRLQRSKPSACTWSLDPGPDSSDVAVGFKSGVRVLSCATGEARFDLADLNNRSVLAELT